MEKELFTYGGIASAFSKFGNKLFEVMTRPKGLGGVSNETAATESHASLEW
jgi:hypothetical protein